MSEAVHYERTLDHLHALSLTTAASELGPLLEQAAREDRSHAWLLDQVLHRELTRRFEKRVAANLKLSGIPVKKPLEDFDYEANPSIPKASIENLATLRFLQDGENVLLLGPTGVGKTHLAIGLTLKAIEQGYRAYFLTLHDLITRRALHANATDSTPCTPPCCVPTCSSSMKSDFNPCSKKTQPSSSKPSTNAMPPRKASSSPATKATGSGTKSSLTKSSPSPYSTGSSITPPPSTFKATPTANDTDATTPTPHPTRR